MPFRDTYNEDAKRRFASWEEFDQYQQQLYPDGIGRNKQDRIRNLNSLELSDLQKQLNLQENLGWGLTEGQEVLMEYDGHRLSDGTQLEMGSQQFFEQMQLGNVLAYPLGDKDPVQLQMFFRPGRARVSFSKPMSNDDIVNGMSDQEPAVPQRPSRFRMLMNSWFGWFRDEVEQYQQNVQAHETWKNKQTTLKTQLEDHRTGRANVPEQEQEEVTAFKEAEVKAKELAAAKAEKDRLASELDSAQRLAEQTELGRQLSEAIYEPDPKILSTEENDQLFPGRTVKPDGIHDKLHHATYLDEKGKVVEAGGYYNKNTFSNLTRITKEDLDLDSIQLGNSGKTVTKSDFCNLAMFSGMDPEEGHKTYHLSPEYDPTLKPAMKLLKKKGDPENKPLFKDEQIDRLISSCVSSMYTSDTWKTSPRGEHGKYIKEGIDPARLRVRDALNEYKQGNPEKLGKILAVGISQQAANLAQAESSMGEEIMGPMAASSSLLKLMNADPKLKEAAFKAGMREKDLWSVEGCQEIVKLYQEAADANLKLAQAANDGKELSEEEKKAAATSIVKADVAVQSMLYENKKAKSPLMESYMKPLLGGKMIIVDRDNPDASPYYNKDGSLRMPKQGTVYKASGGHMYEAMKRYYREKPTSVILLKTPSGKANLDNIADQIVKEDKLTELSTKDLARKIKFHPQGYDTSYGKRGLQKMAEQGMVTMETIDQLKQEVKTGEAAPQKQEQKIEEPANNIQNQASKVNKIEGLQI